MPAPCILYRQAGQPDDTELEAASRHFEVMRSRVECGGRLVIGRHSVAPHYDEVEYDLWLLNARLINSSSERSYIADMWYYHDVRKYTFETWDERTYPMCGYDGPVVVKGRTSSRKHNWDSHMFAPNRSEAIKVGIRLSQHELIAQQGLVYRRYEPLVTYEVGLNGLPFTNEHRCFFLGERLIAHGYYWTEAQDIETPKLAPEGLQLARDVAKIVAQYVPFFVLDVGEKQAGGWVLVEVNDGQMSGLSTIDPDAFYRSLAAALPVWLDSQPETLPGVGAQ